MRVRTIVNILLHYNSIDMNMFISTLSAGIQVVHFRASDSGTQGPRDRDLMLRQQEGLELAHVGRSQSPARVEVVES